jgi:septal ring factor EnvC (AmiA/AmiB activator)
MAPLGSSSSASTPSSDALMVALHEATTAKIDAISAQMNTQHSQISAQLTRLDQDLSDFKADIARAQTSLSLRINNAGDRLFAAIADANAPSDDLRG